MNHGRGKTVVIETKKIKIKYKREYIRAINKLIKFYKGLDEDSRESMPSCPLCAVGKTHANPFENMCSECPWLIFERGKCYSGDVCFAQNVLHRIERLERWKTLIL